jgi:hypothetical protein
MSKRENTSKRSMTFTLETAFTKENLAEPGSAARTPSGTSARCGRGCRRLRNERVGPALADGDRVAINWVFEMTSSR